MSESHLCRGRHLHFAAAVRADADAGLVHVTTAVALKGWRGQVYFAPVRVLHDAVTRVMISHPIPAVRESTTAGTANDHD
jgi:hypothetical protein